MSKANTLPTEKNSLIENKIASQFSSSIVRSTLRALDKAKTTITISGTPSITAVSYFLSNKNILENNKLTHVVFISSLESAQQFAQQLSFFRPDFRVHILSGFDQTPYSGLYPSPQVTKSRLDFLFWATQAGGQRSTLQGVEDAYDIFIVTASGLLQKAPPYFEFFKRCKKIEIGDDLSNINSLLLNLGYQAAPVAEDKGQFAVRGGLIDIFSPAYDKPVRIELFGDQVESLRLFHPQTQLTENTISTYTIIPCTEYYLDDDNLEKVISEFKQGMTSKVTPAEKDDVIRSLTLKNSFPGSEYLLPYCFEKLSSALDYFSTPLQITTIEPSDFHRELDEFSLMIKQEKSADHASLFNFETDKLYFSQLLSLPEIKDTLHVQFSSLSFLDDEKPNEERITISAQSLFDFISFLQYKIAGSEEWTTFVSKKFTDWKKEGYKIFIGSRHQLATDRLLNLLQDLGFSSEKVQPNDYLWEDWINDQNSFIKVIPRDLEESLLIHDDKIIFLRDSDLLGKKQKAKSTTSFDEFSKNAKRLNFGELKQGDLVVHVKHGIGVYEGLKIMPIGGVDSEFIQIGYKDKDKLYLPVYRVGQLQKYSSTVNTSLLDKLGGTSWEKTKVKVKNHLKDIAAELLKLYAQRAEIKRHPLVVDSTQYNQFENAFPFTETVDQLRALNDLDKDFSDEKPMDRLVCGDVGFGKTEVAMRAAFQAVYNKKQVAVLAPTTVLSFQHLETFKHRFQGFDVNIKSLNRFVSTADAKKTLAELKQGKVDILIGTHRLFSKDVQFNDLGLMIIDEEQKFGVAHKEKIKKLKLNVDTLTLSATPIPRTLNMSFSGVRDLSIINTPPVDRLPTRTFVSKFDPELIRKAISNEISRGGQVYFIHNRVQSIYGVAEELRKILPDARIKVAHGQMDEDELEAAMLQFFHHEIDILVCTAIVESGMDVSRANTMFIDQAHMFGLSQLYQLRGRVGRSKARAYCYLLLPKDRKVEKDALERLKIIQENSALGSGIKIAQYDLELRGAGNMLGDDQSGHVGSVGYELYMDLLNEAIADAKGEPSSDRDLDPEINLRIPALIPDSYIPDIRLRLGYYKALADIDSQEELDQIENELKDQFGELPEPVINLMGLMLIRKQCKDLGVRDISAGPKNISLVFTEKTRLRPEKAIELSMKANKKYSLTPDQRLNVRMNTITWSGVYEELQYLISLI